MKNSTPALLSILTVLSLSGCLQAESERHYTVTRFQSAGPQTIAKDSDSPSDAVGCKTTESRNSVSTIGEGADALFQILKTDAADLITVHERAARLLELEQEFSAKFAASCTGLGLTSENTSARIEKLTTLAGETDAAVIQALAAEIWDLFNPNVSVSSDGGTSSPNPFAPPAAKP